MHYFIHQWKFIPSPPPPSKAGFKSLLRCAIVHFGMQPFMEISRFNLKWKGYLCNLCYWVYLVKFIQTAWKVGWHLFCMQFQWNLVQIPRKYIVLSHISSRHMNLKKKKVSGVIIFAICSADGPCFVLLPLRIDRIFEEILFLVEEQQARYYLFVGNIIFPRRPNLWRIIFLVEEILCLWINPNIIFLWGSITSPQILKYYFYGQDILYSAPCTLKQSVWIQSRGKFQNFDYEDGRRQKEKFVTK